jgi:hypothetical protein
LRTIKPERKLGIVAAVALAPTASGVTLIQPVRSCPRPRTTGIDLVRMWVPPPWFTPRALRVAPCGWSSLASARVSARMTSTARIAESRRTALVINELRLPIRVGRTTGARTT